MRNQKRPRTADLKTRPLESRIVLVDDDIVYGALFASAAKKHNLQIKVYESLCGMFSFTNLMRFDAAIIDYQLKGFTGVEIAEYVDAFFEGLPVFLISADISFAEQQKIPRSVRGIFSKTCGVNAILEATTATLENIET